MMRALCGMKLIDRKNTDELLTTIERMAKAAAVRWYGHILQREEAEHPEKKALSFLVLGKDRNTKGYL